MFAKRVPLILQSETPECGLACLAMICSYHGRKTDLVAMRKRLSVSMLGTTLAHLLPLAQSLGLTARALTVGSLAAIQKIRLPAILHWDMNHFVVLTHVTKGMVTVLDPARGKRMLSFADASIHFTGVAVELQPSSAFIPSDERTAMRAWQLLHAASGSASTLAQVLLLSAVLEVFAIASPFFVQIVLDHVLIGRDADLLVVLAVGFALLTIVSAAVTAMRAWLGTLLASRLALRIRDSLFAHLLKLPLQWFGRHELGDIASRFRSVDAIRETMTVGFIESAVDGVMVFLTGAVLFWYSPLLASIVLGAGLLYGLVRWLMYGRHHAAVTELIVHESNATTCLIETMRGMLALKLNSNELQRRATYANYATRTSNANYRVGMLAIGQSAVERLIFGIENIAIIWVAALLVMSGFFSIGMLFGFLAFKNLFLSRLRLLIDKVIEFRDLDLHADRIAEIALVQPDHVPSGRETLPAGSARMEGRRLGFAYGVEGFVVRNIDVDVQEGEIVAVVGPSGSGKTTLMKVLAGLLPATEGELSIDGCNFNGWDRRAYRKMVGGVFQDDLLFAGSISQNIAFLVEPDMPRVVECARLAQIATEIDALPQQYGTVVGEAGLRLSRGQTQRVLLARALYHRPRFLLLDEALDQIDVGMVQLITTRLRELGLGVLLVSHRSDTVSIANRSVFITPRLHAST